MEHLVHSRATNPCVCLRACVCVCVCVTLCLIVCLCLSVFAISGSVRLYPFCVCSFFRVAVWLRLYVPVFLFFVCVCVLVLVLPCVLSLCLWAASLDADSHPRFFLFQMATDQKLLNKWLTLGRQRNLSANVRDTS